MKTNRIIETLKQPIIILGTFLVLKAILTTFSFATNTPWYISQVRLAEFIVLAIGTYYVIKGEIFALWAMGIYLVVHILSLFLAIFVIPSHQYVVKIITIVLSLYFVFGGVVLIRLARSKTGLT